MSRLHSKSSTEDIIKLTGKVKIFHTRLGRHRYTILFLSHMYQNKRRIALVYSGKIVNNRLYGMFTGLRDDEINGKLLPLKDAPTELIEDALRWLI